MNRVLILTAVFLLLTVSISCSSENAGNTEETGINDDSWEKQWGSGTIDEAKSIAADSSDSVYVLGNTGGSFYGEWLGGYFDIFLVKFDSDGNELWGKQWGTICGDSARAATVDSSDSVIVTGFVCADNNSDHIMFLTKFDHTGKELWTKNIGLDYEIIPHSVTVDKEDDIFVAGYYRSGTVVLFKFDREGNELWERQFGTLETWDEGRSIAVDSKGNAFVTGTTGGDVEDNNPGGEKMFLIKFNKDGEQLWVKTFDHMETGIALAVDNSDNVIVIGENDHEACLTKFSNDGNIIWEVPQNRYIASVSVEKSGDILVGGSSSTSKPMIMKYDNTGNDLWTKEFDFENKPFGYISSISTGSSGNIFVAGNVGDGLDKYTEMENLFLVKIPFSEKP